MELPLVLAGPIVRRVEPTRATFWIALSEQAVVEAWVWPGVQVSIGGGQVQSNDGFAAHSTATGTRTFGAHLHIATVTADVTLGGALAPGSLFSYDITVAGHGGLKELGLLSDSTGPGGSIDAAAPPRLALGYLKDFLPSFVTASPTLADLKLVHSSCRKPHGGGPDALAWLDDVIEAERLNVATRPQQLFLTGDQIYADDVAGPLLPMLTALSKDLLGYDETVPMAGGSAGAGDMRVPVKDLPALRRARLVIEVAKLSTTDGASHLLGFGEYAAMYLAVWSPRVWRELPMPESLMTEISKATRDANHLTDYEATPLGIDGWKEHEAAAKARGASTIESDRAAVLAFAQSVGKVARALANCSTYMIFDDHEITDDWYISAPWRTRVLTSPLGRAIVRNGLLAYAIMQAQGNTPEKWADPPVVAVQPPPTPEFTLHGKLEALVGDGSAPTTPHENEVDGLLGLTSPTAVPAVNFHYTVDGPRHRVNVLDSRTRRTYDSTTRHSPPKLVGTALDAMLPAGPMTDGRELLVVVSPVPVLFPRLFEALAQPASAAVFDLKTHMVRTEAFDPANPSPALTGTEAYDIEGWGAHEGTFNTFLRRLATYPRVVVLSGDVHFASSLVADVWTKGDDACDSRILQCTSSAAKNEWPAKMRAVLRGTRSAQRLLQGVPFERLGWEKNHGILLAPGASMRPGRRARLRREPIYVPAGGWPAGTTLDGAKPPDVRYRISVIRDERPAVERGVGAPVPATLPGWDPADPIGVYAQVAAAHQQLLISNTEAVRLMVFGSNIGIVSFADSGNGEHRATHAIFSPVGDGTTGSPFTNHSLEFSRPAAGAPPVLTAGE
ncbi:hypothetical protein [Arthrobacter sp. OAP107]|uniref:hypothetical protein n=1 Tax=Arthrobacter sp. OAP107 TaxID=3156445 RepID=UPI00339B041B